MQVDVDLLLTSQDLFEVAVRHYSGCESYQRVGENIFQAGGLRFRILEPGEDKDTVEAGKIYQVFRKWKTLIAYLDDSYEAVRQYSARGLQTIWLNATGDFAPSGLPLHDGDILFLEALSDSVSLLHKPSLSQCLIWWDEWDLPENVRQHAQTVAWGAYVMAVMMRNKGIDVDPILTHRGGLLHDIDKIKTIRMDGQHGELGANFLMGKGYFLLAAIVREHIMHSILKPGADDRPWEIKLVYFMDKLVEGDQIVTFDVRQKALKKRYPNYQGAIESAKSKVWALNDQICSILSISNHEQLISHLIKLQYN